MSKRAYSSTKTSYDSDDDLISDDNASVSIKSKKNKVAKVQKPATKQQEKSVSHPDILFRKVLELQKENKKLYDAQFKAISKVQEDGEILLKMQNIMMQEVVRLKTIVEQRKGKNSMIETNDSITIPCTSYEALCELEDYLNTDEDVKEFVMNKFQCIFVEHQDPYPFIHSCLLTVATEKCLNYTTYSEQSTNSIKYFTISKLIKDFLIDLDEEDVEYQFLKCIIDLKKSYRAKSSNEPDGKDDQNNMVDDKKDMMEDGIHEDTFPCESEDEILRLEALVKMDPAARIKVKKALMTRVDEVNGIQPTITQMLTMLITPACCKHVTFQGRNNKIGLKNMEIYEIMKEILTFFNQESEESIDNLVILNLKRLKCKISMARKRKEENKTRFLN